MKQAILNLKKKILIVEESKHGFLCKVTFLDTKYGKSKKTGKLTDITEEQFAECVNHWKGKESEIFENYNKKSWSTICYSGEASFFSYLENEVIYFENPLGKKPEIKTNDMFLEYGNVRRLERWHEAESKVWKKENCWLFEIL